MIEPMIISVKTIGLTQARFDRPAGGHRTVPGALVGQYRAEKVPQIRELAPQRSLSSGVDPGT
jgi:hypothetical protein